MNIYYRKIFGCKTRCKVINNSLGFCIITGHMCQNLHAFKFWRCLDICIYCNFHSMLWCHGFLCICFKSQKKLFTYSNVFNTTFLTMKSANIKFQLFFKSMERIHRSDIFWVHSEKMIRCKRSVSYLRSI